MHAYILPPQLPWRTEVTMVASQRPQSTVRDATIGGTVDARIPEPVDICKLPHYLQGSFQSQVVYWSSSKQQYIS